MPDTHLVLRRFTDPGGHALAPGDRIRCEGEGWRNVRALENSRYLRPLMPHELGGPDVVTEGSASDTKTARPKRGQAAA